MRWTLLWSLVLPAGLMLHSMASAQTRVDTNGEFYVGGIPSGSIVGTVPNGWTQFDTGAGGGQGTRYSTGSSSDQYAATYEAEPGWAAESGHSRILGGSGGGGQYGVSQMISTTPGKVYVMMGGVRRDNSTADANARFGVGLNNGTGQAFNVSVADSNVGRSTSSNGLIRSGQFWRSIVATGTQVTASIGSTSAAAIGGGRNTYYDGVRIYEYDTAPNASLQNGDFEGVATDLTNWKAMGSDESGRRGFMGAASWIPLGGGIGRPGRFDVAQAPGGLPAGDDALMVDFFGSAGRGYMAQRVSAAIGTVYTVSGNIYAFAATSDARIGIDPNGGLDPAAASVVWSSALGAFNTWQSVSASAATGPGGVVTVFLATGSDPEVTVTSGAWFNDIGLVPEPTTIGLLLLGSVLATRRRRA